MRKSLLVFVSALLLAVTASAGDKISATDLLAKNADSIGSAEARASIVGLNTSATGSYDVLTHGSGHYDGKASLITASGKFQYVSDFDTPDYKGEQVTLSSGKLDVASNGQTQQSVLAIFLYLHPYLVKSGLFGGVFNGGWPSYSPADHPAKMKVDGLKKYNGRQLLQLSYDPKGSEGDMIIKLYFEPDTYRHVATVFQFNGQTAHGLDVQHSDETLEETFGDFVQAGDLTLPTTWTIHYTGTTQKAVAARWTFKFPNMRMVVNKK